MLSPAGLLVRVRVGQQEAAAQCPDVRTRNLCQWKIFSIVKVWSVGTYTFHHSGW